jgi:hypothetical protein
MKFYLKHFGYQFRNNKNLESALLDACGSMIPSNVRGRAKDSGYIWNPDMDK